MPKVIIGSQKRIEAEAEKKLKAYEKKIRMEMTDALISKKISKTYISEQVGLSRPIITLIFQNPLKAKPINLFKVLNVLGVEYYECL